ncbi:Phosphatidate cytidylyltransferase [Tepidimonas thermarum]|uniref:Phosphatidate cytidylyltransferase n=1 Tax=Tepidimonas thermarum TaxID=335431 RepID=A0A554X906_9BURK|nr:phosphatidate cytidylyltransferase [Tepidimonas thermarum]TSE32315.1 Phosphatidate cytidylyltransferase [Tepidimonas thermarum]
MLRLRVITAVLLLLVLLPAMVYPGPWPFALVTGALMAAAGWEWCRLNGAGPRAARVGGAALAVGLVVLWWRWGHAPWPAAVWWGITALWAVVLVLALRQGVEAWGRWPRMVRLVFGALVLGAAWWALVSLHARGLGALLSAFLLVWVADIAAYFGGKALGRHKLAPRISPGKSWEGALSGALAVLVLAQLWTAVERAWLPGADGLYPRLWAQGVPLALSALLLLTAASVAGDLFESLVKRSAGVKDSSGLLPGHGGVLDRIDALLPVLPAVMALHTWLA